jgi:hypothetical protein
MRFARARLVRVVTPLRTPSRLTIHVEDEGMMAHTTDGYGIFVIEDPEVRTDEGSTDRAGDGRI